MFPAETCALPRPRLIKLNHSCNPWTKIQQALQNNNITYSTASIPLLDIKILTTQKITFQS